MPLQITTRVPRFNERHTTITIWQNGGNAGTLVVETKYVAELLQRLQAEPEPLPDHPARELFT